MDLFLIIFLNFFWKSLLPDPSYSQLVWKAMGIVCQRFRRSALDPTKSRFSEKIEKKIWNFTSTVGSSILLIATTNRLMPCVLTSIACSRVWPPFSKPVSNSPFRADIIKMAKSAWEAPLCKGRYLFRFFWI